ncbi:MAG TPA: alkaline phosphatase family protein [Bryobacteraceae bacterium]|jgi:DNA-binding beta-propeller fold protein YncE|nr:alkaline phosphatase family protein [Bryobacteraceae bacterium]
MKQIISFLFVLIFAVVLGSQPSGRETVGRQADGTVLLPNGWKIAPVGEQVSLDTLPMSSAISPNGKFVLVLNGGYKPPSISVIDAATKKELSRVKVADGWLGLTFSPDGKFVYVGGGSRYRVFEFSFSNDGELKPTREFEIAPDAPHNVRDFIGDVAISKDGQLMYAADLYHDSVVVINVRTGKASDRYKTGRRPYRILFHPDGKTFFVSSWADATVYEYNVSSGTEVTRLRVGPHPTDMIFSDRNPEVDEAEENSRKPKTPEKVLRLFVAAANTNTVFVVNVDENKEMKITETLNVALTPRHSLGMTPTALAISADQKALFTVCSDANAVAVTDISEQRSRLAGFIPTGWYPTAARVLKDGTILVLNGRGLQSFPNPKAPGPFGAPAIEGGGDPRREYVGNLQTGTMSVIPPLTEEALAQYTKSTVALSPYNDSKLDVAAFADDNVIYTKPGRPSPIEHVIYIIKENRTYDQVLGKLGKGNSDPSLDLFDENSAPNHYKLAREFVLFDNFYVNADVSADGHNWATAGIAPDYTQKFWPSSYAKRRNFYDYEGGEPANTPPAGYIWSNAVSAGLSVRNYGHQANNKKVAGPDGVQIDGVRDQSLAGITNTHYRGFDLDYPDVERAKVFLGDLREYETSGNMPRFIIMRLGNDHTSGTAAGHVAPLSSFADNDYALGMVVEGLSKSKFWAKTAIFVIEDDAQNGPDHVDSHRSPVFVMSPYTRRGIIDSSMYNQSSVLRTMELILGLRPLTHFDAGARPMAMAFASAPNMAPYEAEKPRISLTEKNPASTASAARSAKMDFSDADLADDDELNAVLWEAIKKTPAPVPVRSYFSK